MAIFYFKIFIELIPLKCKMYLYHSRLVFFCLITFFQQIYILFFGIDYVFVLIGLRE
jgi:hypothetical protein